MKKILIICLASVIVTFLGCNKDTISGSGTILTSERTINNFTKIDVSGSTNVYVTKGVNFKVEIKGYENLLPHFETKLNNGSLELGYKKNSKIKNDNIQVFITLPVLNSLSLSGSGNIITTGSFINNVNFETSISGSGNINIDAGTTQKYTSTISGSGNINAFGLLAKDADISIYGSGNNELTATDNLKVNISGSGNVYYKGNPVINSKINGSGDIIQK